MPPSARSIRLKDKFEKVPGVFEARSRLKKMQRRSGHATDRVAAIAGGTLVEAALKAAISEHFNTIPLTSPEREHIFAYNDGGLLATLGARITLAYCLGVFGPKTLNDLRRLKKLRNIFAHSAEEVSFADADIASICMEFECLKYFQAKPPTKPKKIYLEVVAELSTRMRLRIRSSKPGGLVFTPAPMP